MDVAGTFFASLMKILIALLDKSVSFHFAKNLDLYELNLFECSSVHLPPQKKSQFFEKVSVFLYTYLIIGTDKFRAFQSHKKQNEYVIIIDQINQCLLKRRFMLSVVLTIAEDL